MAESGAAGIDPVLELDLREPSRHLVHARLRCRPRQPRLDLRLPAWTPGSYLIRDYVRTLEGLVIQQGEHQLQPRRLGVAHWQLDLPSLDPLRLEWHILATELTVRTCHLSTDHGFLALAGVALLVDGERWQPHRLVLQLPEGWQAFVSLPQDEDGSWCAPDFDTLIDSPIEVGPHPCHAFAVAAVPHRWVSWGGDLPLQDPAWLEDVEKVCLACCRLMGEERPPSPAYLFVIHLLEQGYGGLEHDRSCVLQYSRAGLLQPQGRRKLLQLVAHEYLHQWNVRRLRPAELTPIDYSSPAIVPTLWFVEGVTSYLDLFLPLSAGLSDEAALLEDLGAEISRFRLTAGRRVQSLRTSGEEAWVKLYRQDAHSHDNQISYYLKGAVLTLALDLHLRGQGSWIGAVLRQLWQSHGRWRRGYREADLITTFADHAPDLSILLPQWLESTDDPPIDALLLEVGLQLVPELGSKPYAGWQTDASGGCGLLLRRVDRDGPAQRAGLQVGDELLALNNQRLRKEADQEALLGPAENRENVEVLFCRDGRIRSSLLHPDPPAVVRWRLESLESVDATVLERRRRWLELQP